MLLRFLYVFLKNFSEFCPPPLNANAKWPAAPPALHNLGEGKKHSANRRSGVIKIYPPFQAAAPSLPFQCEMSMGPRMKMEEM
jgi:hypothetical protein